MSVSPASRAPEAAPASSPPTYFPLRLLVLYALLWLASLPLVLAFGDFSKLRIHLESLVYPALLLAIYTAPAVRRLWRETPLAPRVGAVLLLLVAVNAQLLNRSELTYPVPAWTMYAAKRPVALVYDELVGVEADGREITLRVNHLVPATRALFSILGAQLERERAAQAAGDAALATKIRAEFEELLREICRRENARRAGDPIAAVRLYRVRLETDGRPVRAETLALVSLAHATAPAP